VKGPIVSLSNMPPGVMRQTSSFNHPSECRQNSLDFGSIWLDEGRSLRMIYADSSFIAMISTCPVGGIDSVACLSTSPSGLVGVACGPCMTPVYLTCTCDDGEPFVMQCSYSRVLCAAQRSCCQFETPRASQKSGRQSRRFVMVAPPGDYMLAEHTAELRSCTRENVAVISSRKARLHDVV
jgi:hypothetical protein